ncbi:MAG TPA: NAD(P)H-quinone oxidoreductase [Clostridia bacterium]|nr:NAD(P)H-quinone oxidoreductase [Clostridia bacterium]
MKAMLTMPDRSLCWTDVPDPIPSEGQVLVEVHSAAMNRADLLQRQGHYPPPAGWPEWMGLEIAGVVKEAPMGSRWQPGDRVCALLGGGGYAEMAVVPEGMVMPIPKGMSFEEAASLPEVYATSYLNLVMEGHMQAGDTVFIPAGASGIASAAIPMAKAMGARVITSVLTEEIAKRIAPLKADVVIVSSAQKTEDVLKREMEAGHPVNVAMDCLSGETLGLCLPYMAEGGRWIVISTLAGTTTEIPLRALLTRDLTVRGSMLRKRSPEEKAQILAGLVRDVWPHLEAGRIRPSIDRIMPITQAEAAHAVMERGENVGKIVLRVR